MARCLIICCFSLQPIITDDPEASEAEITRQGNGHLPADGIVLINAVNIHSKVDIGNYVATSGRLYLSALDKTIHAPEDYVTIAKPFRVCLPSRSTSPHSRGVVNTF